MLFEHCSVIAAVCTASDAQTLQQLQCDDASDCVLAPYNALLGFSQNAARYCSGVHCQNEHYYCHIQRSNCAC